MSIFNKDDQDNRPDLEGITIDTLVGETQKYKTPDELAKAYANADHYIAQTKQRLVELEAENKVLKDIRENTPPVEPKKAPDDGSGNEPPVNREPDKKNEEKDLSTLVQEELERANAKKTFSENVNDVSEKLKNYFGDERSAQKAVQDKAKELNVGVDWLMDVAGKSPVAFYNTLGLDRKSLSTPSPENDRISGAFNKSTRNFAFYEEMRKNDRKAYYSAQVQREMFKDAREQGEAFYGK